MGASGAAVADGGVRSGERRSSVLLSQMGEGAAEDQQAQSIADALLSGIAHRPAFEREPRS